MVKWLRREADHLLPSIAKVENVWSYTLLPHAFVACLGTTALLLEDQRREKARLI